METKTQIRSIQPPLLRVKLLPLLLGQVKDEEEEEEEKEEREYFEHHPDHSFTSHLRPFLLKIDKSIQNRNNYNDNNIACLIPVTYLIQLKRINFVKICVKSKREILVVVFSIFTRERREMSRSS